MPGRKVFVGREVLAADDVNQYLMDQSVPRFPTATARAGAWTNPPDGALSFLEDVKRHDECRGGAWVPLLGGARGRIGGAPLSGSSGPGGAYYQLGQTGNAVTRAGETLEHVVSLAFYAAGNLQTVTTRIMRYTVGGGGSAVLVGERLTPMGGSSPDDHGHGSLLLEESPPAGSWYWRVEAASNIGNPAYLAYGQSVHTVKVTARS